MGKKKADAVGPCRQDFSSSGFQRSAIEHNSSNTGDPLSSGPLSRAGEDRHQNRMSIAWRFPENDMTLDTWNAVLQIVAVLGAAIAIAAGAGSVLTNRRINERDL